MANILYENGFPIKAIVNGKLVDVQEVRHGRWVEAKPMSGKGKVCSVCGEEAYWDTDYGQQFFDYCPNCGAKMDEVEE